MMKKYIVTYHAPMDAMKKMENVSPEEAKKGMEPWMAWAKKCGEHLLDMGAPLAGGVALTKDGAAPSQRNVCGYSILQAESMDEAKSLLEGHPHLAWMDSCEIEVHEVCPLPGQ